jgi:L-amino acid N-acyltransferase YncA
VVANLPCRADLARRAVAPDVRIRPMRAEHAAQVLRIYQAGLEEADASFETVAPHWAGFDAARLPGHRFVAAQAGSSAVLG